MPEARDGPVPEALDESARRRRPGFRGSGRRGFAVAVLLCAAGAGSVLVCAGRVWARVTVPAPGSAPLVTELTGRDLAPSISGLAWAGLAGLAALIATRGWARTAVGALIMLFGGGIAVAAIGAVRRGHLVTAAADASVLVRTGAGLRTESAAWWVFALVGGVLLIAAGALTAIWGHRWPGMSSRYDPDAPRVALAADDPAGLWRSIDRGEDPTEGDEKSERRER